MHPDPFYSERRVPPFLHRPPFLLAVMNKRKLGRTPVQVSELCLNASTFGWVNDEAAAFALLDAYYTCGGSFIQTRGLGLTSAQAPNPEDILGRWRQARAIPREYLVLATRLKLFPAQRGSAEFARLIRESCENSLRRLRTPHIDLLVCEWDEQLAPVGDAVEAVDRLVRAGLVRHAVAANFPTWCDTDTWHRSSVRNQGRFDALQLEYSLMTRARFEGEPLDECREHGLGFLARSPLAGGYLAQRATTIRDIINADRWQDEPFGNRQGEAVLSTLGQIAERRLASPAQIAIAWVLRNPHVTSALVTAGSAHELRLLLSASKIKLTDDEADELANVATLRDRRPELRHA